MMKNQVHSSIIVSLVVTLCAASATIDAIVFDEGESTECSFFHKKVTDQNH